MFYVFMETADRPHLSKSEDNMSLHLHSWKGGVWLLDKDAMWRQAEAQLSSALQLWQLQYKQSSHLKARVNIFCYSFSL